jgi:hypothetical protein
MDALIAAVFRAAPGQSLSVINLKYIAARGPSAKAKN